MAGETHTLLCVAVEPVVEAAEDEAAAPTADDDKPAQAAGDETTSSKKKKKKKDRKRKLDQVASEEDNTESAEPATEPAAAEAPSGEPDKGDEGTVAASIGRGADKSDRTIFVGNVSLDATQNALKTFFTASCGKVEAVRLRFLPVAGTAVNDHGNQKLMMKVCANKKLFTDKRDFCHAYVTFASIESVDKALALNHALFLNKKLRIDRENPVVDPQRSVFVGNLPFQTTDEAVWAFFDKQLKTEDEPKPVENVRVVRDRETGAGKGFGYVLLKGKALAAKALSLAGKKLLNRELRVQVCGKRTKNKKGEEENKALKHEGRRVSGAAGRVLSKKKARGEPIAPPMAIKRAVPPGDKKQKTTAAKPGRRATASVGKKSAVATGKRAGGKPLDGKTKSRKVSSKLAPGVKPKKPKHAARKARQAAEAAAAAKGKK
jgi:nucleolar protein 12